MLSKCANPECAALFHYLRDGKLFQIDTSIVRDDAGPQLLEKGKPLRRIEYFWLCSHCASTMTLVFQRGKGVVTVPLPTPAVQRAAAS